MLLGSASSRLELSKTLQWVWIVKILHIWTSGKIDRLAPVMTISDRDIRVGREFRRLGSLKEVGGRLRVQFYSQWRCPRAPSRAQMIGDFVILPEDRTAC